MAATRPKILCVGGSLRPKSYSLSTCQEIVRLATSVSLDVLVADPRELDLPMYVPDVGIDYFAPKQISIQRLMELYRWADAMVWVSPTYHGTVSGVFKNMLDFAEFLSRDPQPYFQGKAVGLVSINDSTTFAAMRDCARELRAWLAPTHIELSEGDFDSEYRFASERAGQRVVRLLDELSSFVAATNQP